MDIVSLHATHIKNILEGMRDYCSPQEAWRDDKGLKICTAGLEFESGRAPLVRAWNIWGFTRSSVPIKYAFWRIGFPRIQKKKKIENKTMREENGQGSCIRGCIESVSNVPRAEIWIKRSPNLFWTPSFIQMGISILYTAKSICHGPIQAFTAC